jgi:hypothetical protein
MKARKLSGAVATTACCILQVQWAACAGSLAAGKEQGASLIVVVAISNRRLEDEEVADARQ